MIRKATAKVKIINRAQFLDIFMEGVLTPCLQIDIKYDGKDVNLLETWDDIERCNHNGHICRNGVDCCVNPQMKQSPLCKGEVIEIEGDDTIYVVHPLSSLERKR